VVELPVHPPAAQPIGPHHPRCHRCASGTEAPATDGRQPAGQIACSRPGGVAAAHLRAPAARPPRCRSGPWFGGLATGLPARHGHGLGLTTRCLDLRAVRLRASVRHPGPGRRPPAGESR